MDIKNIKIENKLTLYYAGIGVGVGALVGILSTSVIGAKVLDAWGALFVAIAFIYIATKLAPQVLNLIDNPLKDSGTMAIVKVGFLPYFLMWLLVWIMVYTLTI